MQVKYATRTFRQYLVRDDFEFTFDLANEVVDGGGEFGGGVVGVSIGGGGVAVCGGRFGCRRGDGRGRRGGLLEEGSVRHFGFWIWFRCVGWWARREVGRGRV